MKSLHKFRHGLDTVLSWVCALLFAAMVVVGTYSAAANFTYVSLKLVRMEDSRIIRGYDYALPVDRDVKQLLVQAR